MYGNRRAVDVEPIKKQSTSNTTSKSNTNDTRTTNPLAVAGLCVTIGRYWYLFKRLMAVSAGRYYRFEHIVTYSSGKVVAKSVNPFGSKSSQPGRE